MIVRRQFRFDGGDRAVCFAVGLLAVVGMYVTRKCKSTEGGGLMDVRATRDSDIAAGLLPGRLLGEWSGSISDSYLKGCRMRGIGFIFGGLRGLFSSYPASRRKAGMTIAGLHIRDKYKEGTVSYHCFGNVPACFRPESLPKRGYGCNVWKGTVPHRL